MPRRQRVAEKAAAVVARTQEPFDRIAYLVHIAAFFIESWKDALVFAGINSSSRECVESWLWPETMKAILSIRNGGPLSFWSALSVRALWPTRKQLLAAFGPRGSGVPPHSIMWLMEIFISRGAMTLDDAEEAMWDEGLPLPQQVMLAHLDRALIYDDTLQFLLVDADWRRKKDDDVVLLGLFPRDRVKLSDAEALYLLCLALPEAIPDKTGKKFGRHYEFCKEDLHDLKEGHNGSFEALLSYPRIANDNVLLLENPENTVYLSSCMDMVPCPNIGVAALTLLCQIDLSSYGFVDFEVPEPRNDDGRKRADSLEREVDMRCVYWDSEEYFDDRNNRSDNRRGLRYATRICAASLRTLQRTLALIGNKLSSRDKLPQLLRGTGGKTLAQLAKEKFGELLVEHPTFADLFSETRFQADIESIMDDLRKRNRKTLLGKQIAARVTALRREKARREMIARKKDYLKDRGYASTDEETD
jgi:hypothetical protein